jgi:hypothetical protein
MHSFERLAISTNINNTIPNNNKSVSQTPSISSRFPLVRTTSSNTTFSAANSPIKKKTNFEIIHHLIYNLIIQQNQCHQLFKREERKEYYYYILEALWE